MTAVWLPHEFTVDTNEFDSDSQLLINNKIEKPEPTISINSPLLCENPEPEIEMIPQSGISTKKENNTQLIGKYFKTTDITTPTKKKLKSTKYKLRNNKQISKGSASAALLIADVDIVCRKEFNEAQMVDEKQKLKNLLLKEVLKTNYLIKK